ncbi:hypothetical protein EDC15_10522 [Acetobacter aceti NBRC 14818]|nr:hypothetical protein EDC15_10522 [Acetobacter aceti NBRC 14818]
MGFGAQSSYAHRQCTADCVLMALETFFAKHDEINPYVLPSQEMTKEKERIFLNNTM